MVKNLPVKDIRDAGSIPGLGRSPGGGNGNPLMFLDRGAWHAIVHRVAKSQTQLCNLERTHPSLFTLRPICVISPYHLQPKGNLCYLNSQTRQLGLSNGVKFTWLLSCRAKLLTQICVNLPEINYTFHQLQGNSLCKPLRKNGKCCQLHLCTMLSYHLSFNCRILEKKFILKSFFNL